MIGVGLQASFKIAANHVFAVQDVVDPELRPAPRIGSAKAYAFFDKGIFQVSGKFLVGIGSGGIVKIATNDHAVAAGFHVQNDHVYLFGPLQKCALEPAQYAFTVLHFIFGVFFRDHIFHKFSVAFAEGDGLQVHVIYSYGVFIDHNIGVNTNVIGTRVKNDLALVNDGVFAERGNSPMIVFAQGGGIGAVKISRFKDVFDRIYIVVIARLLGGVKFLKAQNIGIDIREPAQDQRSVGAVLFPVVQVKQHTIKGSDF